MAAPLLLVLFGLFIPPTPAARAQPVAGDEPSADTSVAAAPGGPQVNFGYQVFQYLLESRGLATRTDLATIRDQPRNSVVVLLGDLDANRLSERLRLRSFIRNGGAVLLATDQTHWVDGLAMFEAGPVTVPPDDAYQGFRDCPQIRRLSSRHTLTQQVDRLIANRGGWLEELFPGEGKWQTLASYPRSQTATSNPAAVIAMMTSRYSHTGRLVALADHSLLINGMLAHGDNAQLAINLSRWLSWDRRTNLLLAVDGVPLDASGTPLDPSQLNLPPLDPERDLPPINWRDLRHLPPDFWLPFGNQLVATMEDGNFHNDVIEAVVEELPEWVYWRIVYLLSGLVALVFFARQYFKRGSQVPTPLRTHVATRCELRTQQQLLSGQFRNPLGVLAQNLFWQLTGSHDHQDWHRLIRDLEVDGGWQKRRQIRRTLAQLLEIAHDRDLRRIGRRRFLQWAQRIREIQLLHRQKRLRWTAASADA